jgi:hypothetical protein
MMEEKQLYLVKTGKETSILNHDKILSEENEGCCPEIIGEVIDCRQKGARECLRLFMEGKVIRLSLVQAYGNFKDQKIGFFEWLQINNISANHSGKGFNKSVIIWKNNE